MYLGMVVHIDNVSVCTLAWCIILADLSLYRDSTAWTTSVRRTWVGARSGQPSLSGSASL